MFKKERSEKEETTIKKQKRKVNRTIFFLVNLNINYTWLQI